MFKKSMLLVLAAAAAIGCGGVVVGTTREDGGPEGSVEPAQDSGVAEVQENDSATEAGEGWCQDQPNTDDCPAGHSFPYIRCEGGGSLPDDPNCVPNPMNTAVCCIHP